MRASIGRTFERWQAPLSDVGWLRGQTTRRPPPRLRRGLRKADQTWCPSWDTYAPLGRCYTEYLLRLSRPERCSCVGPRKLLEAIAALYGHRTMEMTLIYARIADRVVADEYQAISEKIDALYGQQLDLPADYETTGMAKLRREAHARMLGNGLCTRPVQLDCRMESACETCSYFQTTIEFRPTLQRQRDHAQEHGQNERAAIFDQLIQRVDQGHP